MKHVTSLGLVLAAIAAAGDAARAAERELSERIITRELVQELSRMAHEEIVVLAVTDRNTSRGELSQDEIDALDRRWREERESEWQPLISATLSNPLSSYLTRLQAHSLGLFSEIFVMDRQGLNVGQSNVTSDYWQGDEAKFQRTFDEGAGSVFIDAAEFHSDSGTWRAQVNMTLAGHDGGAPIGAATFELNLTELARRQALQ